MTGHPILALIPGRVVANNTDTDPYGYFIITETRFNEIPQKFLVMLTHPVTLSPYPYDTRLQYCPELASQSWSEVPGSLYVLYGHMEDRSPLQPGTTVASGQQIGSVGNTGASGNPHLHLEMRWGPSGTDFASMGYYGVYTPEEYSQYCNWRVSGKYVLLDPVVFIRAWQTFLPGQ